MLVLVLIVMFKREKILLIIAMHTAEVLALQKR